MHYTEITPKKIDINWALVVKLKEARVWGKKSARKVNSFFVFIARAFFSRTTVKKSSSLTLQAPLVNNWARVFQEATNQFLFNRRTSLLLFPSSCPSSLR